MACPLTYFVTLPPPPLQYAYDMFVMYVLPNTFCSTDDTYLEWLHMSPIFDDEHSLDIDDKLANARDSETGIMGWTQWEYLMEHQVEGGPAIYEGGEEEW